MVLVDRLHSARPRETKELRLQVCSLSHAQRARHIGRGQVEPGHALAHLPVWKRRLATATSSLGTTLDESDGDRGSLRHAPTQKATTPVRISGSRSGAE